MKQNVHPEYGKSSIHCACGKVWDSFSTRKDIRVGICAACHPYFTGKQKLIDTAGRVERFRQRYSKKPSAR